MPCYLATTGYAKITQKPAMKNHLLSTGNNCLAEASRLDTVGYRSPGGRPHAKDPHKWRGKHFLGEALSAVREAILDGEAGSPHPASRRRFRRPTGNAGIHEICPLSSRAWGPRAALTKALLGPIIRVHPPIKPRRFSRQLLAAPQSAHYQNMAPASSGVS